MIYRLPLLIIIGLALACNESWVDSPAQHHARYNDYRYEVRLGPFRGGKALYTDELSQPTETTICSPNWLLHVPGKKDVAVSGCFTYDKISIDDRQSLIPYQWTGGR